MAALVTMACGTSRNHGISQVGWDPQGSLSPIPGSRQEPKSKPCVWKWYPNASWTPSAQGYVYCPGKPVPHPSPSGAEPFPNPQPYPPLMHLHAIHLGPIIWGDRWGEVEYLKLVSHDCDFVFWFLLHPVCVTVLLEQGVSSLRSLIWALWDSCAYCIACDLLEVILKWPSSD